MERSTSDVEIAGTSARRVRRQAPCVTAPAAGSAATASRHGRRRHTRGACHVTDRIGDIAFDVEADPEPGNESSEWYSILNTIGSYDMKAYTVIGNSTIADQKFTSNHVVGQGRKSE